MRIFLSCQQALKPHPVPAYSFWEYYLKSALVEAGHEVLEAPGVDWAEGLTPLSEQKRAEWLDRTWTRSIVYIKGEHLKRPINMFLGYLFPHQVEPMGVRAIRKVGIPAVNFFCDNVREFTKVPQAYREFDLNWVPEGDARQMYSSAGLPFIYCPMPMWVQPKYRGIPDGDNGDVIFVGSHDDLREDLLGAAVADGLKIKIYGAGWTGDQAGSAAPEPRSIGKTLGNQIRFLGREGLRGSVMRATYRFRMRKPRGWIDQSVGSPLFGEEYLRATRTAQVVLGINRCPTFRRPFSNPLRYSRLRDIEAPMMGACYLTEMAPGLEDLYELGSEIEVYGDEEELVEKVAALRGDPQRRLRLREHGQRRALADHTVARSIERIAGKLGISE